MSPTDGGPPPSGDVSGSFERHVVLDGTTNFRDLGGYATADGRRTRWRRLFRADGLSRLTDGDRAVMIDLRLATVIDLRTKEEAERGTFPVDQVPVRYLDLPLMDVLPQPDDLAEWSESSYVAHRYLDMVTNSGSTLATAIGALAEPDALPAVVHCSAGKDRTGVVSALVLAFLGVPDDTIAGDYALSAAAMVHLFERLQAEYPESEEIVSKFAPVILNAVPETMIEFLASVRTTYGSYQGLADTLGLTGAVERLRTTLLEPA
jgi:protein-tyrosine phosphatase